jgi:UDP-GlcNAc:undecaprenyl-phosphate GlcNAc-1-phosphate transferase
MNTYLMLFIIAMCSSMTLTPIVRRISERFGWLDDPLDERRLHKKAVPRLGGIAIFATVLISLAVLGLVDNAVTQALRSTRAEFLTLLVPGTLIFLLGVYDDLYGASARYKLIVQGLTGVLVYTMGGRIEILSVPFVGGVELPALISCALTIFWIVGITNAFNLIDGMDGLATGAALFAALVMLIVSLILGNPFVTVMSIILAGALIGFLRYNFNPASIFLGDSGALFVGFALATLSVQGALKASTAIAVAIPVLAFGLPILDTGLALARRFVSGRPLFEADREHIHHMLLARGWSQRRVALVLYGVCAFFGLLALLFVNEARRTMGFALFAVGVAVLLAVNRLRYPEVDEVKAGVKRKVTERRLRTANNIHIRRASRKMSEAETLGELFNIIQEVLEISGFVYATVQLGRSGDHATNEILLAREQGTAVLHGTEIRGGLIYWSGGDSNIKSSELLNSEYFWSLRLPLSTEGAGWGHINLYCELHSDKLLLDINYLCGIFQQEASLAAERLLMPAAEQEIRVHQSSRKAAGA